MSTYLQGVTDYIPQIQGFKPDYNFLSNVLQQRQSKYDSNYNQLSSVYTSLYNSPMMRESDIARKDAFFKTIDQDIKKISGLDLSLQQNLDTASKVFQPFYDDKNLINDMVKTKKFQNGISKHEALKSCVDPDKCGGQAWESGLAELMYKAEEFKKTSDNDALSFDMPDYTAKFNWKEKAVKLGKDLGYDVTQEVSNGRYIVKDTNGDLVKGGLYALYKNTYGEDPRVSANYKTEAYVQRKRTVEAGISKYGSEEASERVYMNDVINNASSRIQKMQDQFNNISDEMREKINYLNKQSKNQGNLPDENESLNDIIKRKEEIANAQKHLEITGNGINNNADSTDLNILRFRADNAAASELEERDLLDLANIMSLRGKKHEISADPYGVQAQAFSNQRDMAALNFQYDRQKSIDKYNLDLQLKVYEKEGKVGGSAQDAPTVVNNYGAGTTLADPNNKSVGAMSNLASIGQLKDTANHSNEDFIVDAFSQIEQAATRQIGASDTAIHILEDTFGKNWKTIKGRDQILESIKKSGKSSSSIFNTLTTLLDSKKNPQSEVSWADNFMNIKTDIISDIKLKNIAADVAYEKVSETNKKIIGSHEVKDGKIVKTGMVAESVNNPIFYDAELILDDKGFIVGSEEFKQKYDQIYQGKGDANKAFKIIKDKYLEEHDATPGILLNARAGLSGAGTTTGIAIQWEDVTSERPGNGLKQTKAILTDLLNPNNAGYVKAVVGDGSKENIDDQVNNQGAMDFINYVRNDLNNTGKVGIKPNFTVLEAPIIGNDINKSGITITVNNPEYLDKFYGSAKSPKVMDASGISKDQLQKVTLYYDNKNVNTDMTESLRLDPLETVVKTKGLVYDSWTRGGKIELKYDQSSGMVNVTGTMIEPDLSSGKYEENQYPFDSFPIEQLKSRDLAFKAILKENQSNNINTNDPKIRAYTKALLSQQNSNQ